MWQNTFTMPARGNVTLREDPAGYLGRSKFFGPESEKTLWKISSSFGKSTVVPFSIGRTCGMNVSSFCAIERGSGLGRARATSMNAGVISLRGDARGMRSAARDLLGKADPSLRAG